MEHHGGMQFCKDHNFTEYFETSAKSDTGVKEPFLFMIEKVSINKIQISS